jgi:thiamine-phosphate pyrophosphorylase
MKLPFDLYLITDPTLPVDLVAATEAALAAVPPGRIAVQLRAKTRTETLESTKDLVALARALREVTAARGALLFINERADVARIVGADGVHLPEDTFTPAEARTLLGEEALVGVSCHDAHGLTRAAAQQATFATLSPFASSPGKGAPIALARFTDLVAGASLPVLALGGIGPSDVPIALATGVAGVAVIRAVYAARDAGEAASGLVGALDNAHAGRR